MTTDHARQHTAILAAPKVIRVTSIESRLSLIHASALQVVTPNFPHEIKGVTSVTRNSSDSLRARTRRASNESHVTNVISRLTSDAVTRNYNYQFHCGRTHSRCHSTKLASLASLGLKGLEK